VTCPGCGLERPTGAAPYDGYYHASPECWSVYGEVPAAEYQNPVLFGQVHQLSVDTYASQHTGGPHPDKSVCVHLVGLHLALDQGLAPVQVPRRLQRLVSRTSAWPHFPTPAERSARTVLEVAAAGSPQEHARRAREWAAEVWATWRAHHAAIAAFAAKVYP
jgi:hypothetical protein